MKNKLYFIILITSLIFSEIPERRIVAEWEPAFGTMIRWPLGIPSQLVVELARDNTLYVLVENINEQNQANNSFNNWGIDSSSIVFILTETYSHWTRDYGPQFLIGENYWKVINQQFNGYPEESGCNEECDENMIMHDCSGIEFCNNQPEYASDGYDCYVNNEFCQDFNNDGQIMDWIGDGYCDDGSWGLDFQCSQYGWDCGDCVLNGDDPYGYCDDNIYYNNRINSGRPTENQIRGWEEDDNTNIDFANHMDWDILDLSLYFTGGNFITDGYGMGFSTEIILNENNIDLNSFMTITQEELSLNNYHVFDNPNESSIQHIDCMAKLVNPETIIIKEVQLDSPEYNCIESFANSFYELNTFYDRPFKIHRIFCPEINGGSWEINSVAAYTNSLILNNKVLVPQYGIPEDLLALNTYEIAMPGYEVIGFDEDPNNPWFAEDALHCRTIGVFNPNMMHISHKSIRTEEILTNTITVEAEIYDYSQILSSIENVIIVWRYESEAEFNRSIELNSSIEGNYIGNFPNLNPNSEIHYYITAENNNGNVISHPIAGWHFFTTLDTIFGDVNGDILINIQDIIFIINLILTNNYQSVADLNNDNEINILDIIIIVNIILGT